MPRRRALVAHESLSSAVHSTDQRQTGSICAVPYTDASGRQIRRYTVQLMTMNPDPDGGAPREGFQPVEYRCVTSLGEIKAGIMAAMRHHRLNPDFRLAEATVVKVEDEWDDRDPANDLLDYFGGVD